MKELKKYVKNRARPEGCIAESYVANEYVRYCTKTAQQMDKETFRSGPVGKATRKVLGHKDFWAAHTTVLLNTKEVLPYIEYVTNYSFS
jgi:hypothetical protein